MRKFICFYLSILILSCTNKRFNKNADLSKDEFLIESLKEVMTSDQKYRLLMQNETSQSRKDSLWELQAKVDAQNTEYLLDFTRKKGFPNPDRIKEPLNLWVIFHHSPKKYQRQIESLLNKEVEEGRFGKMEFELVKWSLGGRKGIPNIEGIEIIDNR